VNRTAILDTIEAAQALIVACLLLVAGLIKALDTVRSLEPSAAGPDALSAALGGRLSRLLGSAACGSRDRRRALAVERSGTDRRLPHGIGPARRRRRRPHPGPSPASRRRLRLLREAEPKAGQHHRCCSSPRARRACAWRGVRRRELDGDVPPRGHDPAGRPRTSHSLDRRARAAAVSTPDGWGPSDPSRDPRRQAEWRIPRSAAPAPLLASERCMDRSRELSARHRLQPGSGRCRI
jgi:hypothetical protein